MQTLRAVQVPASSTPGAATAAAATSGAATSGAATSGAATACGFLDETRSGEDPVRLLDGLTAHGADAVGLRDAILAAAEVSARKEDMRPPE